MWSSSSASSLYSPRVRYEQRVQRTGCSIRPGLQGLWSSPGAAKRLFFRSRRRGSVHFGPKRHGQERDAQTPDRFVEARPRNHLGRWRRHYAPQTGRSLKGARKMGFLFQDAALFDSVTLYENLALPLARLTTKSPAE